MAKGKQKFYCRKAYERTVGFNNRLQRLIGTFHWFNAFFKSVCAADRSLMVLKTGNRRNKGAFICSIPVPVIAVDFTRE